MIPHPTVSLLVISGHNDQITIDTSSAHCIITQGAECTDAIFQISIVWVRFDMIIDPNIVKLRSPPGPVTGNMLPTLRVLSYIQTSATNREDCMHHRGQGIPDNISCYPWCRISSSWCNIMILTGGERERADITRRGRGHGVLAVKTRVPWDTCSKQRNTAL